MDALISVEALVWGVLEPRVAFLVTRRIPLRREQRQATFEALTRCYEQLASKAQHEVVTVRNDGTVDTALDLISQKLSALTRVPERDG